MTIRFCHQAGLDCVSCSPFRLPIARLSAAQAHLMYDDVIPSASKKPAAKKRPVVKKTAKPVKKKAVKKTVKGKRKR